MTNLPLEYFTCILLNLVCQHVGFIPPLKFDFFIMGINRSIVIWQISLEKVLTFLTQFNQICMREIALLF